MSFEFNVSSFERRGRSQEHVAESLADYRGAHRYPRARKPSRVTLPFVFDAA